MAPPRATVARRLATGAAPARGAARRERGQAGLASDDARVPEALHPAVRATRYGDPDKRVSLGAYELRHDRHADRAWARRTPFRYGE